MYEITGALTAGIRTQLFPQCNKHTGREKGVTYREDKAVLEVRKLFVALLAAEHSVLLVDHFFVAVLAGTGLVEAVLLAQEDDSCDAGVVVGLERRYEAKPHLFRTLQVSTSRLHSEQHENDILKRPRQNRTEPEQVTVAN